jgi:MPBQ/MSBQ methyltransferase
MRFIQHKKEAYWFYRFLSIFYDRLVNPLFWTERMRDEALELAQLDREDLQVIDVGSGTGFTTQGIAKKVRPEFVACLDQSPHQMAKARRKADLQGCDFQLGDAEQLPYADNTFDRYVSAGSIEYWPNPEQGILEAFRVLRPGGIALMIGPLEPEHKLGRFFAKTWMLFPKEEEYWRWFLAAGFIEVERRYVRPRWFRRRSEYGIAIRGVKPATSYASSKATATHPTSAPEKMTLGRRLRLIRRVLAGSIAGFVFIPAALWGYLRQAMREEGAGEEKLNRHQWIAIIALLAAGAAIIWWLIR